MKRERELGFRLLSIEVTGNLKDSRDVIRKKGGNFPVLLDSDFYCREVLQIVRTPTTFIIDETGRIRCRFMGHTKDIEGFVAEVLERI